MNVKTSRTTSGNSVGERTRRVQKRPQSLRVRRGATARAQRRILSRPTPWWKRTFDILVAGMLAVLLSPLLIAIGLYIAIVSPGPILFIQPRIGMGGRMFNIWKFRTMTVRDEDPNAEHRAYIVDLAGTNEPLRKPDHSERLIPGGRLLRQFSLDELPQLVNVMRGEMSVIGPRPDVLPLSDYRTEQQRRFEVAPGITGLWQVSGKNRLSFDEMIQLDIHYVDHRSCLLDAWILIKTIPVLCGMNGV